MLNLLSLTNVIILMSSSICCNVSSFVLSLWSVSLLESMALMPFLEARASPACRVDSCKDISHCISVCDASCDVPDRRYRWHYCARTRINGECFIISCTLLRHRTIVRPIIYRRRRLCCRLCCCKLIALRFLVEFWYNLWPTHWLHFVRSYQTAAMTHSFGNIFNFIKLAQFINCSPQIDRLRCRIECTGKFWQRK